LLPEELKGHEKMYRKLTHLTKFFAGIFIVLLSLLSCAPPQDQAPVIHELLYQTEVPASFDTVLICRVGDPGNDELRFQWSSENGTIRGEGESITWNAPAMPATYEIDVRVNNTSGKETSSKASMHVLPFYRTQIDPDPEINLKLPLFGSSAVSELSLVRPLTTSEINCEAPVIDIKNYKYAWSCNGGKMQGTGVKDGSASKIGWVAPGVPGYYTVTVIITDNWGNLYIGSVYSNVVNPSCCAK
jgi:hypothetical protein